MNKQWAVLFAFAAFAPAVFAASQIALTIDAGNAAPRTDHFASGTVYGAPLKTTRISFKTTSTGYCRFYASFEYAVPGRIFYQPAPFDRATNSYLIPTGVLTSARVVFRNELNTGRTAPDCQLHVIAET